jgi:hypothetical protein
MLTIIPGILIIIYCMYNMIDIDMFYKKFQTIEVENSIDTFIMFGIIIWLIIHVFSHAGLISLLPCLALFINTGYNSEYKRRFFHRLLLLLILIPTLFIIINKLFIHFNFWTFHTSII